ncbi:MAG: Rpn family recombination-promoting nuclease/putative transposase [Selenomonadaceae bacterium]|nr:Rpn family recombination-promoting nuclease/putative transposase [Selenomonadaceae bacterium]
MTNPRVRDTLFCKYAGTASNLLAISNAIRGTNHTDASRIQINTLQGSFYSNLKNDISFILDTLIMMLIEHQTTLNPNMPVRLLNYVAELFKIYLEPEKRKMYSSSLIQIPAPEFYVFYDGDDTSFERKILKLSDAFKAPSDKLELIVHVYNLATGKNEALKSICKPLREYSTFSNHYKLLRQQGLAIDEAVRDTIRYCIDNNVMRDYLQCNESEVINMFGFEWNEKEEREALLEAGRARERIDSARTLLTQGIVTLQALQSSGYYSQEELAAIAKPL